MGSYEDYFPGWQSGGYKKCLHIWVGQQGVADGTLAPRLPKATLRRMLSLSPIHLGVSAIQEEETTQSFPSKNPEWWRELGTALKARKFGF